MTQKVLERQLCLPTIPRSTKTGERRPAKIIVGQVDIRKLVPMKSTPADGLNKHQLKTEATLRGLLDAAERVFVRDGYERAQMETIAAEAGRTKGALYAHFRSKEDIFFALLERKGRSRRGEFERTAAGLDPAQRRATVKKLFLATLEDETWPILMLEFKLFALRHKASLDRIRDLHQLMYEHMSRALSPDNAIMTAIDKQRDMLAIAVLRSVPSAIILEKQFSAGVSPRVARDMFELIFDLLLDPGNVDPAMALKIADKPIVRKPKAPKSGSSQRLSKVK